MKARNLEILIHNPFYLSRILHHFISGTLSINDNGVKTELIGLVLPFILNQNICNKLQRLNKNSKLNTIIESEQFEIFISQINSKISHTRKKTKHSLIVLATTVNLNIADFVISDKIANYKDENDIELRHIYKAAYNLGILIAKERYLTVMSKLRITQL